MPRFIPLNYQQNTKVVINYQDQLPAVTSKYAIHHLIEDKMDLSVFYPKCRNRPSYLRPGCAAEDYFVCLFERYYFKP
ncbi:MAG: hypothetical protein ABJV04_02790 [Aliiglaciecola sp.]|uniref:hypothetical protein n=1 Tax=Aliiglaciecola sp. TaxID=1872441 RepID=UPI00329A5057